MLCSVLALMCVRIVLCIALCNSVLTSCVLVVGLTCYGISTGVVIVVSCWVQ